MTLNVTKEVDSAANTGIATDYRRLKGDSGRQKRKWNLFAGEKARPTAWATGRHPGEGDLRER